MSVWKTIIEIIHVQLKCTHLKGLSSVGWIYPTNFLIPPSITQGELHYCCGKGIHNTPIIERYRHHMGYSQRRIAWLDCLGVVFCRDNEASHVVNEGLILALISMFWFNQLLTRLDWINLIVNIDICEQIKSFKWKIKFLLWCQQRRTVLWTLVEYSEEWLFDKQV